MLYASPPRPSITGLHHLSLTVRDADRSERFYTSIFEFVRVLELADEGGRGHKRVLVHPGSGIILGFTVHQGNDGSAFDEMRTGLDHLAFTVASRSELDAWVARLDDLGVPHGAPTSTSRGDLVALRDPDNIQIELWANTA